MHFDAILVVLTFVNFFSNRAIERRGASAGRNGSRLDTQQFPIHVYIASLAQFSFHHRLGLRWDSWLFVFLLLANHSWRAFFCTLATHFTIRLLIAANGWKSAIGAFLWGIFAFARRFFCGVDVEIHRTAGVTAWCVRALLFQSTVLLLWRQRSARHLYRDTVATWHQHR